MFIYKNLTYNYLFIIKYTDSEIEANAFVNSYHKSPTFLESERYSNGAQRIDWISYFEYPLLRYIFQSPSLYFQSRAVAENGESPTIKNAPVPSTSTDVNSPKNVKSVQGNSYNTRSRMVSFN